MGAFGLIGFDFAYGFDKTIGGQNLQDGRLTS
jgi:hypothetical protein